jgi:hypothetical protein
MLQTAETKVKRKIYKMKDSTNTVPLAGQSINYASQDNQDRQPLPPVRC